MKTRSTMIQTNSRQISRKTIKMDAHFSRLPEEWIARMSNYGNVKGIDQEMIW